MSCLGISRYLLQPCTVSVNSLPPTMRSQLTRHVLRHLLVHQGMLPPCSILARPSLRKYPVVYRLNRPSQRRTFLGFFEKPPRLPKEPQVEPGYELLVQLWNHQVEDLRLPSNEELASAFHEFVKYKKFNRRHFTISQARIAHHALEHLWQPPQPGSQPIPYLKIQTLRLAREVVMRSSGNDLHDHVKLEKALFSKIRESNFSGQSPDRQKVQAGDIRDMQSHMRALAQWGASIEARDQLWSFWTSKKKLWPVIDEKNRKALFIPVIRGLAREGREADLLKLLPEVEERVGFGYVQAVHEIMTTFYAQRNDFDKMKEWFHKKIQSDAPPSCTAYTEAFRCALRNNHREWAVSIYQDVANRLESLPASKYFDEAIIFVYQWAVRLLGKGAEHIEHMILAHRDRHPGDEKFQPMIETINGLIEVAMEKDDAYLAERFTSLIPKLGLQANEQTCRLQIEYRICAKDLDGAFSAYRSLQGFNTTIDDWPVLNRLIRELCAASSPNHDKILDVISFLEQSMATLEAETVVSVCLTFLKNDEHFEVIDTLSLHSVHFGPREREVVCKSFIKYCLDQNISTARVWDAYALLRQFFPELGSQDRVQIMDMFFDRKRPDMATHVFGHMRQAKNINNRPTLETYVRCFEGFGRRWCQDEESLKMVHNMLKIDTTITPNTRLYNALMIAYTACELEDRALDFWEEISNSVEGPSYSSLEIVFTTYQITDMGHERAKVLWQKLQRMEIDVPAKVYTAYTAALAAHSDVDDAKKALLTMEDVVDQGPDHLALASVYNVLQNDELQDDFEKWAKDEFPHVWGRLQKARIGRGPMGNRKLVVPFPPLKA